MGSVDCYTQLQTPIDAMLYRVSCVCRVLVMSALYSTLHALQCVLAGDRRATTNKGAWQWATAQGPKTAWDLEARWVVDGPIWTSAGVTAGAA